MCNQGFEIPISNSVARVKENARNRKAFELLSEMLDYELVIFDSRGFTVYVLETY